MNHPFFHRFDTKDSIVRITNQKRLTIYAGAGVTIDKSGLGWQPMVEKLAAPVISPTMDFDAVTKNMGVLSTATATHSLYGLTSSTTESARQRISARLSEVLYEQGSWRGGLLSESLSEFVYYWNHASEGKRPIAIATTNYDDYLYQALVKSHHRVRVSKNKTENKRDHTAYSPPAPTLRFPTDQDPLLADNVSQSEWSVRETYPRTDEIPCIYLHGRIPPRQTKRSKTRLPVVSEIDYELSSPWVHAALVGMLNRSSFLMVGCSVTDAPLLRALWETRHRIKKHPRWVLIKRPSTVDEQEMLTHRLELFKVEPIYYDHHLQAAQFFNELSVSVLYSTHEKRYIDDGCEWRYGQRLNRWWHDWNTKTIEYGFSKRQGVSHKLLRKAVPYIRDLLDASVSERLKIEVWLRWKPNKHRKLRLWCSSSGTWADPATHVDADILTDEAYVSTEAFRRGHAVDREQKDSRWKRIVAMPFWDPDDTGAQMVTGVVTIASMSWDGRNSLDPAANSANIREALEVLQAIGSLVSAPDWTEMREWINDL